MTEKSIGEQLDACDTLALREDLPVCWRKDESKSAKIPGVRPVFLELLGLVEKGKIQGIVCWHVNRLARNPREAGSLMQLLVDGKLKEIRTPHATYRAGDNILPLAVDTASAAQYSIDLSNTVKRSMDGNFRRGNCNSRAPQGYMNRRDPMNLKRGVVEIDPERFPIIQKAWMAMASGNYTPSELYLVLKDDWGYRTRATRKQPSHVLSLSAIYTTFRNPFYAGFIRFKGELQPGNHTPMISLDTFERVQELLTQWSRPMKKRNNLTFTGVMRCGYCNRQVTGEVKKLSHGGSWETYHCCDTRNLCTAKGMSREKVDALVLDRLSSVTIKPALAEIAKAAVVECLNRNATGGVLLVETQEDALKRAESRISGINEMWLDGLITDPDEYRSLKEQAIEAKNSVIKTQAMAQTELHVMKRNVAQAADFCAFSRTKYLVGSPEVKRRIAKSLASYYKFFGLTKEIQVKVKPLLTEFVAFANTLKGELEPPESGSQIQKEPAFFKSILVGGPDCSQLELPKSLVRALKSNSLEELDDGAGKKGGG